MLSEHHSLKQKIFFKGLSLQETLQTIKRIERIVLAHLNHQIRDPEEPVEV